MIDSINIFTLRNEEFVQFGADILTLCEKHDPTKLRIVVPFTAFKTTSAAAAKLLNLETGSSLTPEVNAADYRRDEAIKGIALYFESLTHHFKPETKKNAEALYKHVLTFGTGAAIANKNNLAETAALSTIISDWSTKPSLAAALKALGIEDWRDELNTANLAFNQTFISRSEDDKKPTDGKFRDKRKEATTLWQKLRDGIEARIALAEEDELDTAPYTNLVGSLNSVIAKYNLILANRENKNKGTDGINSLPTV